MLPHNVTVLERVFKLQMFLSMSEFESRIMYVILALRNIFTEECYCGNALHEIREPG
jgi:hypothetical protein